MPHRYITNALPPRLTYLDVVGASLGVGVTTTTGGSRVANRLSAQLARMLGATTERNVCVSASVLCQDNDSALHDGKPWATTGGWVTVCQQNSPGERAQQPLASNKQLVLITPTSDLPALGPTRFESLFPVVLEAVIRRLRAGAVYGHGHSSVSYPAGTWTTVPGTNKNSGSGYRYSASGDGAKWRITVPSWVKAGSKLHWQTIFTHDYRPTHTFTKNGAPAGSIDLSTILAFNVTAGKQRWSPYSHEFTVNPGDVIEGTVSNTNGGIARPHFDSYSIEAEVPPIVAVVKVSRFLNYDVYGAPGSGWTYIATDADAALAESVIDTALGPFPTDVLEIATDPIMWDGNTPRTWLFDDYAHPNAAGCSLIAAEIYRKTAALLSPDRVAGTGTV